VPVPYSDPAAVDPEEALLAAVSSCHMLWFLALAAHRKFTVDRYADEATGEMGKNDAGKSYVARVTLRPKAEFSGDLRPSRADMDALHRAAHEECFIAHSIRAEVSCLPDYGAMED
jgi:organic hydroperoxide reductase OsmC/OhrA